MKICAFGGGFDPPHLAHLEIANAVIQRIQPDCFYFVPGKRMPHGKEAIATDEMRLKMLELTCKNLSKAAMILDYELKQDSVVYTINTINFLRKIHSQIGEIFWVIGSDWLDRLDTWKDINNLRKICQFLVLERPDFPIKSNDEVIKIEFQPMNISSKDIRSKVSGWKDMLLPEVAQWIEEKGIYHVR